MRISVRTTVVAIALVLFPGLVSAGEIIDEVRIGASGSVGSSSLKNTFSGSAEVYIAPFSSSHTGMAKVFLEPRIQLGASGGHDAVDQIYAGLNWHVPLTEKLFTEFGIGGTVHNGNLDVGTGPLLGCRVLFREHAALGLSVTQNVSVLATVDHSSHADLCDGPNDGLTHVGLAVGVKF